MSQKIGLEVANGYIKVVSDDIEISYPNRLKMLTGEEFDVVGTLGSIYEFEGDQYIIDSTGTSSGGRNSNRYLTKEYLLEALVAISQVIKERNIVITVGVPCRDFRKEQLKESIINNLKGRHELKVIKGKTTERFEINILEVFVVVEPMGTLCDYVFNNKFEIVEKGRHELKVIKGKTTERFEINILEVFVVVEPMGTLCDYVFNNKFEIVDNRNHSKSLIIDIGYSTTDILATDGLRIEKLHGADVGCMDIANQFLREINSLDEKVQFTLRDLGLDIKPIIKKFDYEFDFTEQLNKVKRNIVKSKLIPAIKESGLNPLDFDVVLYTGGGALAFENHIELAFNEKVYVEPQLANARGFYKYTMIKKG